MSLKKTPEHQWLEAWMKSILKTDFDLKKYTSDRICEESFIEFKPKKSFYSRDPILLESMLNKTWRVTIQEIE